MDEVFVILEWDYRREHLTMPKKVASIYKKFIKINSEKITSVDDGLDMYLRSIEMKQFDDPEIITAYNTLIKITYLSSLNIAGMLFDGMFRNIENYPHSKKKEKKISNELDNSDIGFETRKLTEKHYDFILKYEKEILYYVKGAHL